MGTITIKSKSLVTRAKYEDSQLGLVVEDLNVTVNAAENKLKSVIGEINRNSVNKEWVGRFNGRVENGKFVYDVNGVDLNDMADVKTIITDIDSQVKPEQEGGEE
jgi:hypothetical protein